MLGLRSYLRILLILLAGYPPSAAALHGQSRANTTASPSAVQRSRVPVHPTSWVVLGFPDRNAVRIGKEVGWCPEVNPATGDVKLATRPRITGVKQVSRRRAVILTAYLSQKKLGNCLGVITPVEYVVHIRNGLNGRALYDGSKSPPIRRWPRGNP
jgi:hypothetical protein